MANAAHPSNREEAARTVRAIGEVAYNRQLMHSALVWIADNPARFLRLTAIRAIYFWSAPTEHPETLAASALLTIFALAGFAAMAREGSVERTALFATVWLVYPLLYYVVQFSPRYRVPIDWSITLPAGLFLYQRLKAWSSIPGFPVSEPV
jgi:hypothetical protein